MTRLCRLAVGLYLCFLICISANNTCLPGLNVTSPRIGASRLTCSYQSVTWYQSGLGSPIENVYVIIYGGLDTQLNLGIHKNGNGIANLRVPGKLRTGLYRAKVFGFHDDSPVYLPTLSDQSPWFKIVDKGCPGLPDDEHCPEDPIFYPAYLGYDPKGL